MSGTVPAALDVLRYLPVGVSWVLLVRPRKRGAACAAPLPAAAWLLFNSLCWMAASVAAGNLAAVDPALSAVLLFRAHFHSVTCKPRAGLHCEKHDGFVTHTHNMRIWQGAGLAAQS